MPWMLLAAMVSVVSGEESQQVSSEKLPLTRLQKWDGLVFGDHRLFLAQVLSIVITIAVAIVGTLICIGIVRIFTPLRVDPKEEMVGLDASQHGENAYPSFNGFD